MVLEFKMSHAPEVVQGAMLSFQLAGLHVWFNKFAVQLAALESFRTKIENL